MTDKPPETAGETAVDDRAARERRTLDAANSHTLMLLLEELMQLDRALVRGSRGFDFQAARVVQRFNYCAADHMLRGYGPLIAALAICIRRRELRFAWIERALLDDSLRVGGDPEVCRNFQRMLRGEDPLQIICGDAPLSLGIRVDVAPSGLLPSS